MSYLVNLGQFNISEEDIKNIVGYLDPKNKKDVDLIKKLLRLGSAVKRGNNRG